MKQIRPSREKVGKIVFDLHKKEPDAGTAREQGSIMLSDYVENIEFCIKHALKKIDCSSLENHEHCKDVPAIDHDFYVKAILKAEPALPDTFRMYYRPFFSCPTPDYDQTVYKYHYHEEKVELIWTIPCKAACHYILDNFVSLPPEQDELKQFVLDFAQGNLFIKAKKLNGEHKDSSFLEKVVERKQKYV